MKSFFKLALAGCVVAWMSGCVLYPGMETMPRELRDAVWTDDANRAVRLADFRGEPVVLSMLYQRCAGACPLTLTRMKSMERALKKRGSSAYFVLVTLDPRHDTPRSLANYRVAHGLERDRWVLLTGPLEQTASLANVLGIHRVDDASHIMHVGKIVRIAADGAGMEEIQ